MSDTNVSITLVYVLLGFVALILILTFTALLIVQHRMTAALSLLAEANKSPAILDTIENAMVSVVPASALSEANTLAKVFAGILEVAVKDPSWLALIGQAAKLVDQVTDGQPNAKAAPPVEAARTAG